MEARLARLLQQYLLQRSTKPIWCCSLGRRVSAASPRHAPVGAGLQRPTFPSSRSAWARYQSASHDAAADQFRSRVDPTRPVDIPTASISSVRAPPGPGVRAPIWPAPPAAGVPMARHLDCPTGSFAAWCAP